MKLEPDRQINLTREALTTLLNEYGIADFIFEPISEGIANSSVRVQSGGKEYVLRVYAQGKSDEDIAFEIIFQNYLRTHGIPTPAIHPNKHGKELTVAEVDGKRWQVILMDFVEGQSTTTKPSYELIGGAG